MNEHPRSASACTKLYSMLLRLDSLNTFVPLLANAADIHFARCRGQSCEDKDKCWLTDQWFCTVQGTVLHEQLFRNGDWDTLQNSLKCVLLFVTFVHNPCFGNSAKLWKCTRSMHIVHSTLFLHFTFVHHAMVAPDQGSIRHIPECHCVVLHKQSW